MEIATRSKTQPKGNNRATYVLVHGGWHGSWCWKRVRKALQDAGHEVFTPSLTGVGERSHLNSATVNLSTHIADVVNLVRWELSNVILCGHSYGGFVISCVADQIPASFSFTYGYVVTRHDPDRLLELRVERPFRMLVLYELDDAAGGTLVSIHATGNPSRYFGWATPLMKRQVRVCDLGEFLAARLDGGDRRRAINVRLAHTQKIEVRTVRRRQPEAATQA